MIVTLLGFIFVKAPVFIWKLLVKIFKLLLSLLKLVFIRIPIRIFIGLKVFFRLLRYLFVPKERKPKTKKKGGKKK